MSSLTPKQIPWLSHVAVSVVVIVATLQLQKRIQDDQTLTNTVGKMWQQEVKLHDNLLQNWPKVYQSTILHASLRQSSIPLPQSKQQSRWHDTQSHWHFNFLTLFLFPCCQIPLCSSITPTNLWVYGRASNGCSLDPADTMPKRVCRSTLNTGAISHFQWQSTDF